MNELGYKGKQGGTRGNDYGVIVEGKQQEE